MKKVLLWGFSIFCIVGGFVYFPSFTFVIFELVGILSLPINVVRNWWKRLPINTKIIKPILIIILFLVACEIAPTTSNEVEDSTSIVEQQKSMDVIISKNVENEVKERNNDGVLIAEDKMIDTEIDEIRTISTESTEPTQAPVIVSTVESLPEATIESEKIIVVSPADVTVLSEHFNVEDIPVYSGSAYVVINNNVPFFEDTELSTTSYEFFSPLDSLGRCGVCVASIGIDIMPTEERGEIGNVKPSGWKQEKYIGLVEGNYLYNRCHLIGYQLTGENDDIKNLITGTRALNVEGMLPFENLVESYVKETANHVMYRVTPIFKGNDLLARGVMIEAKSVEDNGEGILFCVYCYNAQQGVMIDYSDGASTLEIEMSQSSTERLSDGNDETLLLEAEPTPTPESEQVPTDSEKYAVNSKNGKIHIVGECTATGNGEYAMTSPVYFDTYEAAETYSIQIKPNQKKRKCGNCW